MTHEEVARQLIERVLARDAEAAAECYAEDAIAWRNLDGRELVKKQIRTILRFLASIEDLRYDDLHIRETPDGFVQQHTMRCTAPGGEAVQVHCCLVGQVREDKLVRIDEYMDSVAMAPLMG